MNKELKSKIVQIYGSQADFAQALKIAEPLISRVIRQRQSLALTDQEKWAKALKCKPADIFNKGTAV